MIVSALERTGIEADTLAPAVSILRGDHREGKTWVAGRPQRALIVSGVANGRPDAKTVKFTAALNSGQVVPHLKGASSGAAGRFTATLNGTALKWTLSFSHLSGAASAAYIHMGARGVSGGVLVPLCAPCTSPAAPSFTMTSTSKVTQAEISALEAGKTYVNVHTAKYPNGEIRGQVTRAK